MATALLMIMGGAVATVLGRGLKAWQKADGRLQRLFVVEKSLNRMGEDLRNGLSLADRPFEGLGAELLFVTAQGPTRLAQVGYALQSGGGRQTLVRTWQPFPSVPAQQPAAAAPGRVAAPPLAPAAQAQTMVPGVKAFSIEYGYLQPADAGTGSSVNWAQTWDSEHQPLEIPRLVRIRIEVETPQGEADSSTREFLIPHGAFRNPPGE
ncbi:MAG: hypothetical protein HYZ93_04445 [Candidatus Omnitrophica bacterium]|nr:hypothetical protein [Candidatus Omnitrophota bacterium]